MENFTNIWSTQMAEIATEYALFISRPSLYTLLFSSLSAWDSLNIIEYWVLPRIVLNIIESAKYNPEYTEQQHFHVSHVLLINLVISYRLSSADHEYANHNEKLATFIRNLQ